MKNFPVILKCKNSFGENYTILTVLAQDANQNYKFQTVEFGLIPIYHMKYSLPSGNREAYVAFLQRGNDCELTEEQYKLIAD
jgi:hypothetical protein